MSPAALARIAPTTGRPTMALVDKVSHGLPLDAADAVSSMVAPADRNFKYRLVPKATYARRLSRAKAQSRNAVAVLSKEESERVVRLAGVWTFAVEVMQDEPAARRFMTSPHPLLKGRTPLDVTLDGELGGKLVHDLLGRLAYGSAV